MYAVYRSIRINGVVLKKLLAELDTLDEAMVEAKRQGDDAYIQEFRRVDFTDGV